MQIWFTNLAVVSLRLRAFTSRWCVPPQITLVGLTLSEGSMDSPLSTINVKSIFIMSDHEIKYFFPSS